MVSRLKTIFFHPFFIGSIAVYILIRYLRKISYPMPDWVNGQLTDLICMPVVLMICLAFVRILKKDSTIEINKWLIALICLEYAILFEWILPLRSVIYTADWNDVAMYFTGGIIFYFIQPSFRQKKQEIQEVNS